MEKKVPTFFQFLRANGIENNCLDFTNKELLRFVKRSFVARDVHKGVRRKNAKNQINFNCVKIRQIVYAVELALLLH